VAESEGDSKFMKGLFVGFLLGVLIALGVGGSLAFFSRRQDALRVEEAQREAEIARKDAEAARKLAEEQLEQATLQQRLRIDMQNRADAAELEKRLLSDLLKDAKQQDK
jgi:Tfp pilus assembly protein PilX